MGEVRTENACSCYMTEELVAKGFCWIQSSEHDPRQEFLRFTRNWTQSYRLKSAVTVVPTRDNRVVGQQMNVAQEDGVRFAHGVLQSARKHRDQQRRLVVGQGTKAFSSHCL